MTDEQYEEYLAHHGILGQKWGVRRYQNPDGSLTTEGRRRYGAGYEELSRSKQKKVRKLQSKIDKNVEKYDKREYKTLDERARARDQKALKADKKIAKGKMTEAEKKAILDDHDLGTEYVKKAYDRQKQNVNTLIEMNKTAVYTPEIKKTAAYETAKRWSKTQKISEAFYSQNANVLMEAMDIGAKDQGRDSVGWTRSGLAKSVDYVDQNGKKRHVE